MCTEHTIQPCTHFTLKIPSPKHTPNHPHTYSRVLLTLVLLRLGDRQNGLVFIDRACEGET